MTTKDDNHSNEASEVYQALQRHFDKAASPVLASRMWRIPGRPAGKSFVLNPD